MSFNLHDLSHKLGRREYNRFIIPGATISWKLVGQESFPDRTSPLSDISKGGLSLLTNDPPSVGSDVSLLISVPQKAETFELLGKVIYSVARGPRLTYKYRVGVALQPFDQPEGNSLQSLTQLEALEKIFGKHKKS
jgi:Tfp pilus assembly protein PilZ